MNIFILLFLVGYAACDTIKIVQPAKEIIKEIFEGKALPITSLSETKIVGGSIADISDYPWQISLQLRSSGSWYHICGGSIIANTWIVTAAHCVDGQPVNSLRIAAGMTSLSDASRTLVSVSRIIMHPDYSSNGAGYPNDIALLQLSSPLAYSGNIQPIRVPSTSLTFSNMRCDLSGWGRLSGSGSSPTDLQAVTMGTIANTQCSTMWSAVNGAAIFNTHICIYESGKSACSGDSGGPMTCVVSGTPYLAGATSWGISTCSGDFPSVYARVSEFRSWIQVYVSGI